MYLGTYDHKLVRIAIKLATYLSINLLCKSDTARLVLKGILSKNIQNSKDWCQQPR